MTDIMIDLETFGKGKNACVVQIGACEFNRHTGEIGKILDMTVDAESAMESGAEIDASTIYWWLKQSPEAIQSICGPVKTSERRAFEELNVFLKYSDLPIWSHATFDFVIVMETLKRLKIKPLFSFRAARDIRTLTDIAGLTKSDFEKTERVGVHHNALSDCLFQVKYCVEAFRRLQK